MRVALCGPGRSGKDTVSAYLSVKTALRYQISTSEMACQLIFDTVFPDRYLSLEECHADRVNHRVVWREAILAYNQPSGIRLYEDYQDTHDIFNGIRCKDELQSGLMSGFFDLSIWVDREVPEDPSLNFGPSDCDIVIPNQGSLGQLYERLDRVCKLINF